MIIYSNYDVFAVKTDAIVNTVNCEGYMGKGLAFEMKARNPEMFIDYLNKCKNHKIEPGKIDCFKTKDLLIINFPTKLQYKNPSKIEWIEMGLKDFVSKYKGLKIKSISFPKLGTNNGLLNWSIVKPLMEKYLSDIDIDVYICLNTERKISENEKKLIDRINNGEFKAFPFLSNIQKENISLSLPLNRFSDLHNVDKIGLVSYKNIYDFLNSKETTDQMKFDFK